MKTQLNFNSAKEMICWIMDNEGIVLFDYYGRRWLYSNFEFKYSDLGDVFLNKNSIDCLHLYGEGFYYFKN